MVSSTPTVSADTLASPRDISSIDVAMERRSISSSLAVSLEDTDYRDSPPNFPPPVEVYVRVYLLLALYWSRTDHQHPHFLAWRLLMSMKRYHSLDRLYMIINSNKVRTCDSIYRSRWHKETGGHIRLYLRLVDSVFISEAI